MELETLQVKKRDNAGKGVARKVRALGHIPAVLYGGKGGQVSLSLQLHNFERMLHRHTGSHAIINLEIEGAPEMNTPAMIKSIQRHPVRSQIVHADFLRISLDERIHVSVPLRLKGQCKGVVAGGMLDQQLHDVELECLALQAPEFVAVDVTNVNVGESVHVSDLPLPEGVVARTPADRTIVTVHLPRAAKAASDDAGAAEAAS